MKTILFSLALIFSLVYGNTQIPNELNFSCGNVDENHGSDILRAPCSRNFCNFLTYHENDLIPQNIEDKIKINTNIIIVQRSNGSGNYDIDNQDDLNFWESVFEKINYNISNMILESCPSGPYAYSSSGLHNCQLSNSIQHYSSLNFEFVPNFIEIKNDFYWNHRNDYNPDLWTPKKKFLREIFQLAKQDQNYKVGYNVILTEDGIAIDNYEQGINPFDVSGWAKMYGGHMYSMEPDFVNMDNEYVAFHAPYTYFDRVVGSTYYNIDDEERIKIIAGGFLHEYGHSFLGLYHTNDCSRNIMNSIGGSEDFRKTSITGKQAREWYLTTMSSNMRNYLYCEESLPYAITVSQNEVWDNNLKVFGDITVLSGGQLTVRCKLDFFDSRKIIVNQGGKLIIDGGTVTSSCGQWEGIIVKGNYNLNQSNPANYGIVQTMNGAVIENARIGIGYADEGPHTDWGGLIQCDNTSFINCWKGAQFLKYNFENESYFNECHFENCNEGVTIWANKGIEFTENTFDVIKNGITSVDANYLVTNHNIFDGGQYGILSQATAGNVSQLQVTELNTFTNLGRGISISGNDGYKIAKITNNDFTNNDWGVLISGEEYYEVNSNRFNSHNNAIISAAAGIPYNFITCNQLNNQGVGILTMWYNGKTTFLSNQFLNTLSTGADYAGFFADIIDEVGNSNLAANNSFSNIQRDISSNMECDYFEYYKFQQDPGPDYPGNYSVWDVLNGAETTPCGITPLINVTKPEVVSKIQNYCIKLALYRSNPNNTVYKKEFAVAHRLLHEYFYAWASQMEQTGNYAEIEALLKTICNDRWKKKLFNLYFKLGNYAAAWQVLDELEDPRLKIIPIVPEDLQDDSRASFVETQRLNVLWHQSNFNYSLSPSELNVLRTNAEEKIPENAYAKGLLYLLTGEIVEPVVPAQYNQPVVPRNTQSAQTQWVIFPNPAREEVRVKIGGNTDFSGTMTVFHINGNKVGEERITGVKGSEHGIDISTYANGVYYLIMRDEASKPVFYGKFVKNNLK